MHDISLRQKSVESKGINAHFYRHTQDVGWHKIEFERSLLLKFCKSPYDTNMRITMFHFIDTSNKTESFTYKMKGFIFAASSKDIIPIQYMQSIKLKSSPLKFPF